MAEFTEAQHERNNDLEAKTLGFLEFMPPKGIENAKKGNWWLQNTDRLIGNSDWDYTEEQIENIFSTDLNEQFREDPLEGHLLTAHIKESTNFMSCFVIVTVNDVTENYTLKDDFIQNMIDTGKGNKGFVFIPLENLTAFDYALQNESVRSDLVSGSNIKRSDIYFRPVRYLSDDCYKNEATKIEKDLIQKNIRLQDGLTAEQADDNGVYDTYFNALNFAVCTKLSKYSKQQEARLAINFSDSYTQQSPDNSFIKLHSCLIPSLIKTGDSFSDLKKMIITN